MTLALDHRAFLPLAATTYKFVLERIGAMKAPRSGTYEGV